MTAPAALPTDSPAALAVTYRRAAEVIATGGLCKRAFYTAETGEHCTIGALQSATGLSEHWLLEPVAVLGLGIEGEVCACCNELQLNPFSEITKWNDRDETTADDVVALFNRTADALEATS